MPVLVLTARDALQDRIQGLDAALRQACIRTGGDGGPCQPIDLGPREWTVTEYLMLQALTGWDKEITPNAVEVYSVRESFHAAR